MLINTLCAIIGLLETHTITNSRRTLTLGRLAYIYHDLYPGSAKDQREKCAHISTGSTGH